MHDYYLEIYYNETLKYNDTLKSFQNVLNKSKYSNLYNYCGLPPWKINEIINTETYNISINTINNTINTNNETEESQKYVIENDNINDTETEQILIIESDIIINFTEADENSTNELYLEDKIMNSNNGTSVNFKNFFRKIFKKENNFKLYIIVESVMLIIIILIFIFVYKYRKRKSKFIDLA